jgi:hypothetical protein
MGSIIKPLGELKLVSSTPIALVNVLRLFPELLLLELSLLPELLLSELPLSFICLVKNKYSLIEGKKDKVSNFKQRGNTVKKTIIINKNIAILFNNIICSIVKK